jgi:choline dehydrogenase-like flavoprotein
VIGGGTAGSAVATRLSQGLPWASILLIEAGPSALGEDRINIPGRKGSTLGTIYDWNFTTIAQPAAKNRIFAAPRGKVLGGSSALNLMTWDRASVPEYDAWGDLDNPGWSWSSMIAAMKKVENFTDSADYGSTGVGTTGPIKTVINRFIPEQQKSWIPTMNNLGVPLNLESLGGNPLGVMYQPSNIDSAIWNRSYAANGYLPRASTNLQVMTGTRVSKINLKKLGRFQVATGVTLQDGTVIRAREEVVLSAGSIQSPGMLELSGIGRQSVLTAAGVSQVVDLPGVGENLQDHIRIQSSYQLKDNYTSFDILRYNATFAAEQLALWRAGQYSMYDYTGSGYTFTNWKKAIGDDSALVSLARQKVIGSGSVVDRKKLAFMSNPAVPQLEVIFSDGYTGLKGYPQPGTALYGKGFLLQPAKPCQRCKHVTTVGHVITANHEVRSDHKTIDHRTMAPRQMAQDLRAGGHWTTRWWKHLGWHL